MKNNYGLTNTELLIMELLWKEARPMSFREIMDVARKEWKKEWKVQTLNTFLNGLQKTKLIRAERSLASSYNVYYALVTREQHIHKWTKELVEVCYDNSLVYLVKAYIGDGQLSEQEKKELQFRDNFMRVKEIDLKKFLQLPFNATTNNRKKQLHEERIIFNHIAYLEFYREFVLEKSNVRNEDKITINGFLVEKIFEYLKLYDKYIINVDSQRNDIKEELYLKAEQIKLSKYTDFNTKIEREKKSNDIVLSNEDNIKIDFNFSV